MHNSAESSPPKQKIGCFALLITACILSLGLLLGSAARQHYLVAGVARSNPPATTLTPETIAVTEPERDEAVTNTDAAPTSNVDRLVIVTDDNQLITIAPDGSESRQLTQRSAGWAYLFPAWSPDNQQIAAIGVGRRGQENGVFVLEDSAETTPLSIFSADRHPIYLYWTPDSQSISFIAASNTEPDLLDLHLAPHDASNDSRILTSGSPLYWDFTTTGDTLLFNTRQPDQATLAYTEIASGDISPPIATPNTTFQVPDISYDDAYIAYSSGQSPQHTLIVEDRANGTQISLKHTGKIAFVWSPTTNWLAYVATEQQFNRPIGPIRLLGADDTSRNVVDDAVIAFFWSPDGNKIAYLILDDGGLDANHSRTRRASVTAQLHVPTFGLWVIDLVSAEKQLLGSVQLSQLFVTQFLPFYDQYAHSHALWSPDSTAIALPIQDTDGEHVIYRFALDGSRPTEIAPGKVGFWSR